MLFNLPKCYDLLINDSLRFDEYFGHFEGYCKRLYENVSVHEKNVQHVSTQTGGHIDNPFIFIQLTPNYPWAY